MKRSQYRVASSGKYGNKKVELDGYVFDSQAEAARYLVLKAEAQGKAIWALEVHPIFQLQSGFRDRNGKWHREISYEADFGYYEDETSDLLVVEEVKGYRTAEFRIKEKWFLYLYGKNHDLRIVEV